MRSRRRHVRPNVSRGIVILNWWVWQQEYPELANRVTEAQAQAFFVRAGQLCNNTPDSPIPYCDKAGSPVRAIILGLLVAHMTVLFGPDADVNAPPGRITNASEGSVSAAFDLGPQTASSAWWNQTKYGALAWMMTAPYRTFRFYPAPNPYLGVSAVRGRRY